MGLHCKALPHPSPGQRGYVEWPAFRLCPDQTITRLNKHSLHLHVTQAPPSPAFIQPYLVMGLFVLAGESTVSF